MLNRRHRRTETSWSAAGARAGTTPTAAARLDTYVRTNRLAPRHRELLDGLTQLDVTCDQAALQPLIGWVREQYEMRQGGELLGLLAQCHLGRQFVDHRLDLRGSICQHYAFAEPVPQPYLAGRGLAQSGTYAFIEFYTDGAMVPVLPDGTPVEL